MDQKTIAWVSYLTLIGWIIALVSYNGSTDKSSLAKFHLRQAFGLMLLGIVLGIVNSIISGILISTFSLGLLGIFEIVIWILAIGILVLWIMGLIAAVNGEEKELPVVGAFSQKTFTFIK